MKGEIRNSRCEAGVIELSSTTKPFLCFIIGTEVNFSLNVGSTEYENNPRCELFSVSALNRSPLETPIDDIQIEDYEGNVHGNYDQRLTILSPPTNTSCKANSLLVLQA